MSQVTVVARIKARRDAVEEVSDALLKLVEPTLHKDDGCIDYDLYQDNENPSLFFFLENWESEVHLKKHLDSEHIKAYRKATEGLIEQRDLHRLTRIS
ncbi:MAG: putative quinol monooxygenase [Desulfobacterales bacterium]|jgi:quinol monooxygenase YgiN